MQERTNAMVKKALSLVGGGYIYGATGWVCTPQRLKEQARQYPQYADLIARYGPQWIGKPCYDCAQLTRAIAAAGGVALPNGANLQWHADWLWQQKGTVSAMPDEAGLFLFTVRDATATHAGISIGRGECVDAPGHAYGVVRRRIRDASFTHWARLKGE